MIRHITHRCHKREFLLKFAWDRRRWLYWLYESKKRYKLTVLNYTVTSNHIHLLVLDETEGYVANLIELTTGRTAREYNIRKGRKGAFWEDRYHATAAEGGDYLKLCLVYIDMNMVRAGAVDHFSQWGESGFNEIQQPPKRYGLINRKTLMDLLGFSNIGDFKASRGAWILEALVASRDDWDTGAGFSKSIAVGSESFVNTVAKKLGCSSKDREKRIKYQSEAYLLRSPSGVYRKSV